MSTTTHNTDSDFEKALERASLRSAFVSLFWAIFSERKKQKKLTLEMLAKKIGGDKSQLSRWFNGDPNWRVNTIANMADALEVDLEIRALDRLTPEVIFTPAGITHVATSSRDVATTTKLLAENPSMIRSSKFKFSAVSTSTREAA